MGTRTIRELPSGSYPLSGGEWFEVTQPSGGFFESVKAQIKYIDHNKLYGKQGGNGVDEFYHLDQSTHDDVATKTYVDIIPSATFEPTGFAKRTDSTMSFNDLTGEFSVTSLTGQTVYFIHGKKYTFSGTKTLAVFGQGANYFYIDENGNLNVIQTFDVETLLRDNAYVAVVYWDSINSRHIYMGDERHGINWDWNHHSYEHFHEGTVWRSGLALSDVIAYAAPIDVHDGTDNTYWAATNYSGVNWIFNSVTQNHTTGGTHSINFSNTIDTDVAQFTNPDGFRDLTEYISLEGWIYLTNWSAGHNLQFRGWNSISDTIVGNNVNITGYINTGTLNAWQMFTIPLTDMGLDGESIDAIQIQTVDAGSGTPDGFIDDIQFIASGGNLNSELTFNISSGVIYDEDLRHEIDEVVKGSSSFNVFYLVSGGNWTSSESTSAVVLSAGSGRIAYNEYVPSASMWKQSEVPDGGYVMSFIFSNNDPNRQIISIQAQKYYTNVSTARSNIESDLSSIIQSDLPFAEFIPIAVLLYRTKDEFTNDYKAKIIYIDSSNTYPYQDARNLEGASTAGGLNVTNHQALTNRTDPNAHPQYVLVNGTRAFTGAVGGITPTLSNQLATKGYVDTKSMAGTASISLSATSVSASFSPQQADTDYAIAGSIANYVDVSPLDITFKVTKKSKSGFTVTFNQPVNSTNYKLDWVIVRY